jgi:hypothetical protein
MVSLVLEAFNVGTQKKAWGTGFSVVLALVLRFFPKLRHLLRPQKGYAFWTAMPWLLSAALVFFLVFKELPRRRELLANSWLKWQVSLEKTSGQCTAQREKVDIFQKRASQTTDKAEKDKAEMDKEAAEKPLDKCLAENVGPLLNEQRAAAGVANDLMAGQMMLANDNTRSVLWDRMSIDEKFLGSGFSVPRPEGVMAARVPEYFVPNLMDESSHVWVWKFDHGMLQGQKPIMEWKLMDVLQTFQPENHLTSAKHSTFETDWKSWIKSRVDAGDAESALVRFALFDTQKTAYSGCLGRADATRVFMSTLGELGSKTVGAAAQSTGYIKPEKADEAGQTLFIWVYAPDEEDQVVRATWGNVLANFGNWITAEPCKKSNLTQSVLGY